MLENEIKTYKDVSRECLIRALALEVELLCTGFNVNHTNRYSYEAEMKIQGKQVRFVVDPYHVRLFVDDQVISQEYLKYFSLSRVLKMPFLLGGSNEKR